MIKIIDDEDIAGGEKLPSIMDGDAASAA